MVFGTNGLKPQSMAENAGRLRTAHCRWCHCRIRCDHLNVIKSERHLLPLSHNKRRKLSHGVNTALSDPLSLLDSSSVTSSFLFSSYFFFFYSSFDFLPTPPAPSFTVLQRVTHCFQGWQTWQTSPLASVIAIISVTSGAQQRYQSPQGVPSLFKNIYRYAVCIYKVF